MGLFLYFSNNNLKGMILRTPGSTLTAMYMYMMHYQMKPTESHKISEQLTILWISGCLGIPKSPAIRQLHDE